MKTIIAIAFGGALGALSRYAVSWFTFKHIKTFFPVGTLTVNLIGSFLIGLLWGLFAEIKIPSSVRIFLLIGFLGSFTTFSAFTLDNYAMFKEGKVLAAFTNIFITNFLCLALTFAGIMLAKSLTR
ncbi:hypothetical protein A2291_05345 [candidate division WOR-1 bacterium RIFOXYB2_FULL_42_35]|uniref:Fluoride-specific ion channel FluC n=1 Tax=candidate division WOR-1 bacterium RIFOXYC2_FULL_41_25 TaxID=1802586 RepID=A0A1F4TLT2_UNCSA|nr:MAG: hypothetical protein A2247_08745 [candidate division WOR-1 bacterium RIFOXYA2_FULL_41_14]OGC23725.1 MAG: hypothetical protein A2291_05345 [candidate division WOR-1 bacterium RIFOXYB2_FULL_42_35]OGC33678.1 MAG: hypothetical protein A2462_02435 [candidate division WOR-1 bacterium RIFOXYC2_FULL_41_25]